ncbi:hypothetical protein AXG93_4094s1080 [Marchantia polymorpha subsp. ruderalis]|uniref:Uncharacterized protein n=1 Tax=Marchantia polymorpha subsp. ruderalis TaxID=1480154 RepID=A0A176VWC7_MARPO|nr:hypothetical protein AXG93_4094s1080 [Marchantia polymorpha subsp. ruderalis]
MLAGRGAEVAAEEAAHPSSRESPRISAVTEILKTEHDTGSEEEEVDLVRGTPTGVLCEQVVATNPELIALDLKYRQMEERYDILQERFTLTLRLQKKALELQDSMVSDAQREFEVQCAKIGAELNSKRAQNYILVEELVRQTWLLEQSEIARKADKELLRRLQSQCNELRAQRVEAKLQCHDLL